MKKLSLTKIKPDPDFNTTMEITLYMEEQLKPLFEVEMLSGIRTELPKNQVQYRMNVEKAKMDLFMTAVNTVFFGKSLSN
jgi:hypothetical protein